MLWQHICWHRNANLQGFKVGLCDKAPLGAPHSILSLANNCSIASTFGAMSERFGKLFKRQVYVHHYTQYMDVGGMAEAQSNVHALQHAYEDVANMPAPSEEDLYVPVGTSFL